MKRVLMVDDAATVRMYYRKVLEDAGFAVDEAVNGMEGLEKALGGTFDLYIVDINMPVMDGYTLLVRLRDEPPLWDVPAIMISTEAAPQDHSQALVAGANLYLIKPVTPETLCLNARLLTGARAAGASLS